ncbi:S-layer homology domain-containing protein [Lysinibacillus macroides]|uniref:S-layer homology domain-containing protein n=2 Tax=Lysinibacillus macroides TaxID=33935 RepID=UPI00193574D8|nr:S-layer homology domain-containing protein [Lysinibacillus macroides]
MENKKWLKIISVFVVGLLLFNLISFGGFADIEVSASSDTNVALGKQYLASSVEGDLATADMAFDEDELTYWGSNPGEGEITESNPAWLMVNLGTPHTINRWVVVGAAFKDIAMESYTVKNIKLEGSNDGVNFTQIDFSDNNIEIDSSGYTTTIDKTFSSSVTYQYFRVKVTETFSSMPGEILTAMIYEFELWGYPVAGTVDAETPAIGTQPVGATVNQGATSPTLSVGASVGDGGILSYQWYSNTTNSPSGGTAISGATNATYEAPTSTVGTVYYYVVVTNTNSGVSGNQTAPATSNVVGVSVNALVDAETPVIGTQPTGATVNQGAASPTLSVGASVGDGGILSYQWYSNTTNSPSGGTAISGATNATYEAPTSTVGTVYYYVVVTNTNSGVSGNQTASATSNVVGVTVNALVDAETPVIGTQPTGATVNQGATSPTLSVGASVGDGGILSYQWYSNTTNSPSGGTAISGATNATYEAPTSTVGTVYYYVVVTNTNSGVSGNQTAPATSNVVGVTVNALVDAETPVIGTQPTGATVNQGATSPTLSVGASVGDGGILSYQWYSNTTNSPSGGTAISGATNATYEAPTSTVGTVYYYVVVTNTKSGVSGNPTAPATSNVVGVTVNALVDAETPVIGTQPTGATVNQGATSPTLSVGASVGDGGILSYQWYSNTTNSPSGGTAISGATNATYEAPTSTVGTVYYYVVVTNTNSGVSGNQTAPATSNVVGVTVNALVDAETPVIGTQPTGATVNQGATSPTLSVGASVGDGGILSYQWYSNTTNSPSGGTAISGATNATYEAPTSTVGTVYYYVVVTNTNSGVSGNQTASATSNVVGVTVNALVDAETPVIGTQPTGATVNQGATSPTLSVGASVGDGGILSYQWYSNTTNSPSGGTAISGATNATYEAPTSTVGTVYYYVVVTNTNSGVSGSQTAISTSSVVPVIVNSAQTITITYNGNTNTGGIVPTDSETYEQGEYVTVLGNTGNLVKAGYMFAGWNTQADGSGIDYASGSTFPMGSGNVILYAKWNPVTVTYTVTFDVAGGSAVSNQTVAHGEKASQPTPAPAKAGYTFGGWYTSNAYTMPYNFDNAITANTMIYAKWISSNSNTGGGNTNSSSNPESGSTTPSANVEEIVVDVESGDGDLVSKTTIKRTKNVDNTMKDEVTLTAASATETIRKLKEQGNDKARIIIPDQQDQVNQVQVSVPKNVVTLLQNGAVHLEIVTDNVRIEVPKTSLEMFHDDLYFRLVPIKGQDEQLEIKEQANKESIVQQLAGSAVVELLGRPMTIETNMQSRPVTLTLPLPTDITQEQLDHLAIYIEHSDGTKEVVRGTVVEFQKGIAGLQFEVNKFSTFSILYLPEKDEVKEPTTDAVTHLPYIQGYPDGTFRPEAPVTRAQMASMFARHITNNDIPEASATFTDTVKHDAKDAIEFVTETELFKGITATSFQPNGSITRAQMATVAARWIEQQCEDRPDADFCQPTSQSVEFKDVSDNHWARKAIDTVNTVGIMTGIKADTFNPEGFLTRAQAVKILNRLFERQVLTEVQTPLFPDVPRQHWAFYEIQEAAK